MEQIYLQRAQLIAQLRQILMTAPIILLSLSCHEFAHAFVSYKLGDPTPKREGRISLNPLRHLDMKGLVCLLVFHFGWAKPVMIDPRYYKNRRSALILVSAAGPLMNFFLTFVFLGLLGLYVKFTPFGGAGYEIIRTLLVSGAYMNTSLGVFNLIPVPPLDGSKILMGIVPKTERVMRKIERYGMIILLLLIISGIIGKYLGGASRIVVNFFWNGICRVLFPGM